MLEAISKVQVYFENDIYMEYDIEWFIFTTLHVIHVYRPVFKGNPNFVVLEMLEAITKAQVYLEKNILRDYNNYTKQEFSIRFSFLRSN